MRGNSEIGVGYHWLLGNVLHILVRQGRFGEASQDAGLVCFPAGPLRKKQDAEYDKYQ